MFPQGTGWIPDRPDPRDYGPGPLIGYFEKKALGRDVSSSVMFLYKIERNLLGTTGDGGAFLRTGMQALRAFGVPPDTSWSYDPSLLDIEPQPFHYAYAANYKATHYFRLDDAGTDGEGVLARAKASLAGGIPMMFGLALFSSFGSGTAGEIPMPVASDTKVALHALVAAGYDDARTIARVDPSPAASTAPLARCASATPGECRGAAAAMDGSPTTTYVPV